MIFNNEIKKKKWHKIFLLISAIFVLSGIVTGFIMDRLAGLKYFTYLSNIFLTVYFLLCLFLYNKMKSFKTYFSSSIIVAIFITAAVYNCYLVPSSPEFARLFSPKESLLRNWHNCTAHFLSLVLALFNYFMFEKKGCFTKKHILTVTIFPFIYWSVLMILGFHPYSFMDVNNLGWVSVIIWFFAFLVLFLIFGFFLVILDKYINRRQNKN